MEDVDMRRQKKNELMQELKKLEPEGMPGIEELREEQLRLKRRYYEQLRKWEIYLQKKEKYNKNGSGSPPEPPQQLAKTEFISFLKNTVSYFQYFENLEMLHPLLLKEATEMRTEAEFILHHLRTAKEDF